MIAVFSIVQCIILRQTLGLNPYQILFRQQFLTNNFHLEEENTTHVLDIMT